MADLAVTLRQHERIGLDTPVFIYHIEATARFAEPAAVALDELARGAFAAVTSVLTLMEIAVKPLQLGRPDIAEEYEVLLANYPNLVVATIDRPTARWAAELRATHRLRPADALQVATCRSRGDRVPDERSGAATGHRAPGLDSGGLRCPAVLTPALSSAGWPSMRARAPRIRRYLEGLATQPAKSTGFFGSIKEQQHSKRTCPRTSP